MSDGTEQSDEILALQSIYGDEAFMCEVSKKPYTGRIYITCQIDSQDVICNDDVFQLKYFSPIVLDFLLPSDYPSSNPPVYELSCHWLTSDQLGMLKNRLMEIWLENCNNVVLFTWISFLQVEVLEYLSIKFPLTVTQEKMRLLTEYSLQREEEAFNKDIHECPICFCEKPGSECIKLGKCGHLFCKECLSGFLSVHIADGSVNILTCLVDKCDSQIYPNVIKGLVSEQEFERYDRLLLKNTLDVMSDVKYCPRITCGSPVVIDKEESMAVCQVCRFAFCILCMLSYHGIEKCRVKTADLARLRNEYLNAKGEHKKKLEDMYGKRKLLEILNDFESHTWMQSNCKKCPKCQTFIEKSSGCNKMHCNYCNAYFCWLCLNVITSANPYDHFSKAKGGCFNKLFQGMII